MKEAMETMPETLEYGVINANVLPLLKDVLCQVGARRGGGLGVGGRPTRVCPREAVGHADPQALSRAVLAVLPLVTDTRSQRQRDGTSQ